MNNIVVEAISPFSQKVVVVEKHGQYALAKLNDNFNPDNLNWKSRMFKSSMISKGNYKPMDKKTYLSDYLDEHNLGKSMTRPIIIDLIKHELHKERLIKRAVQVKHANGHITTRMQWVSPETGKPAKTTYNHTKSDKSIKKMEELDNAKHPIMHVPIDQVKRNYEQDINHEKARNIKGKMEQGKKLPPVILDHDLNIQEVHHRYTAAMESGYSHVPAIIRSPDKVLKKQTENKLKGEKAFPINTSENKSRPQKAIENLSKYITDNYSHRLEGGGSRQGFYQNLQEVEKILDKRWESIIKPSVLENIENDHNSSDLARQRQKSMLDQTERPEVVDIEKGWLHHKELCKSINNCILGEDLANEVRKHLSQSTISINTASHVDEILKDGYKAGTLRSYIDHKVGPGEYDIFKKENEGEDPLNIFENIFDLGLDHTRQMVEYNYMGIHPLDEVKPVYISYNPFNYYKGGAPGFGDPDQGGSVLTVDPSVLSNCTMTTDDSFNDGVGTIAKPMDMEHLGEIWMNQNLDSIQDNASANSNNSFDLDSFLEEEYPEYICTDQYVQGELQYHKSEIEPHLLKKWSENNE